MNVKIGEIVHNCKHKRYKYSQYIISPLSSKLKKYLRCFEYFLYLTPNISFNRVKINEVKWEKLYEEFVNKDSNLRKYNVVFARTKKDVDYFSNLKLDGNNMCFECNRIVLYRSNNENRLAALIRHIRNALAHGHLYYKIINKKDVFFLEDEDKGTITSRMILSGNLLIELKNIIEKNIK